VPKSPKSGVLEQNALSRPKIWAKWLILALGIESATKMEKLQAKYRSKQPISSVRQA
jgi:hypothetical protein